MTKMNREDIIRIARESAIATGTMIPSAWNDPMLEHFAKAMYSAGAAAEREAILQMSKDNWYKTQEDYDAAIRARGNGGEK